METKSAAKETDLAAMETKSAAKETAFATMETKSATKETDLTAMETALAAKETVLTAKETALATMAIAESKELFFIGESSLRNMFKHKPKRIDKRTNTKYALTENIVCKYIGLCTSCAVYHFSQNNGWLSWLRSS
ncbi:MAG: hypothetical protein LBO67_04990 [Spirochaetaceae bacterium]|jgi:hypothetical protein|nr:hypothetical protein [Spirochaetaceae bacterium]